MGQCICGVESVWNKGTIDFFNQVVRAMFDLVMNALLALQKLPYLAFTVAPFMETAIVSLPDQYIF